MRKKKIALVNVFFAPQAIGGATRVLMDNVDIMIDVHKEKFELVAFTSDHGFQKPHTIKPYLYKGMRVYRAGIMHRVNMDWHTNDQEIKELFTRFLDFEKPDIVHFHCIQRLTASVIDSVLERGIPFIITVHDAWWISDFQFLVDNNGKVYPNGHPDPFLPVELPEFVSLDDSFERRSYLKGLLSKAYEVQTVSEAFAKIYRLNGVQEITVNRNGIQPRAWLPRTPLGARKICVAHIGGMSNHKGYHLFKEALHAYPYQNLEALVVDHSAPPDSKRIETWGTVSVTFIDKVPQKNIQDLYVQMDVLVAISIWPESFGLVTREATAAGVWVVASDLGGIGEDVIDGQTGNRLKPAVNELVQVFKDIDSGEIDVHIDPELRKNTRTVSEQVQQLISVYDSIDKIEKANF